MKTPNAAIWAAAAVSSIVIICITVLLALGKPSDTLTGFIVAVPGALATAFGVYTAMKTQKISVNVNGHLSALAAAAGIPSPVPTPAQPAVPAVVLIQPATPAVQPVVQSSVVPPSEGNAP